MPSPFKFLDAYTKEDRDIFFGRENEIEELYQKVFDSKVLLVCGISGTGKTSLIDCGLANKFEESDWLPIKVRRGNDITASLKAGISKSAISPVSAEKSIVKQLQSLYLDHFKPIYMIFDQFEEVFIFGSREERQEFIKEIKLIIDSDIQCRLLFVMREESLAGAIEFEREIPTFLTNRCRIEKMTWHNAKKVIEEPCRVHGIAVEEGLSEKMLGKLSPESTEVELTYLQVLLDKLYNVASERNKDKPEFSAKLLSDVGDVSDLLGSFLEEQISRLDDPEAGLVILKSFVSTKGTKRQVSYQDIYDFAATLGSAVSSDELTSLIHKFINLRILRDKDENDRYELRHDSLANKIYEKITLYEKELLEVRHFLDNAYNNYEKRKKLLGPDDLEYIAPYEKKLFLNTELTRFLQASRHEVLKAKNRRRRIISVMSIALIAVLLGFTLWALNERTKAVEQQAIALEERNTAEEQRNVAIEANEEAERARKEAVAERQNAETNERIANEQRQEAVNANEALVVARKLADAQRIKAEENEEIAVASMNEAERLRSLAEEEKNRADRQRELATENFRKAKASELQIKIPEIAETDPTLAIRLAEYALELDDNDNTRALIQQIYSGHNFYRIVARHRYPVNCVDISADGKTILTGSGDNTACLWDIDGNKLLDIDAHEDEVTSVAFTGDGSQFVTGSRDKTAKLWDLSGNLVKTFPGHEGSVTSVAISPDGNRILTGSEDLHTRLWDKEGLPLGELISKFPIVEVAFSPTGSHFLFAFNRNKFTLFVNDVTLKSNQIDVGKEIHYLEDGTYIPNAIQAIAFSADGQRILTGSADRLLRFWTLSGRQERIMGRFDEDFTALRFTPDGSKFVIGARSGSILMLNLNGKIIQEFIGHKDAITSLALSSDGRYLLSGSLDNTARIWDVSAETKTSWQAHSQSINEVLFSPDSKTLLTGSADGTACLWDLKGNKRVTYKGHKSEITSLAFASDGKQALTGSLDETAILWDIDGRQVTTIRGHDAPVRSVGFSNENKRIITGSNDRTARLWDTDGQQLNVFTGHSEAVHDVAFVPGSDEIISAARLNVYVWNSSGELVRSIGNPSGRWIWNLDLGTAGKTILLTDRYGVQEIDLSGNPVANYIPLSYMGHKIASAEFSQDGKLILCVFHNHLILHDKSGNRIKHFTEETWDKDSKTDYIWGLSFSPDGTSIAAGFRDGSIAVFNLKTPLDKFRESGNYEPLSIYQKLQFALISEEEIFDREEEQELLEAASFFLDQALATHSAEEKTNNLVRSEKMYQILLDQYYNELYLTGHANVLTRLTATGKNVKEYTENLNEIYDHLLRSDKIRVLNDAARFYHDLSLEPFSISQRVDFAHKANGFYEKILELDNSSKNLAYMVDNLISLQVIEPSDSIGRKLDDRFNQMLDKLNISERREKERYFHQLAESSNDYRIAAEYYKWTVNLIEKIIAEESDKRIWDHASSTYNNYAHAQLFTGQFDEAITNARRGIELKDENIIYTKLALAYLLNDQKSDGMEIINNYGSRRVVNEDFNEYILRKIIELQGAGINHPNLEEVRKQLEATIY